MRRNCTKRALMLSPALLGAAMAILAPAAASSAMTAAQRALLDQYEAEAKAAGTSFSAERGKAFFREPHTGGKPETPACTECHTTDLTKTGRTRAGKEIEPMAASISPKRYTDRAEVEKWFKRNCADVTGRECTLGEKGDVLTYLLGL